MDNIICLDSFRNKKEQQQKATLSFEEIAKINEEKRKAAQEKRIEENKGVLLRYRIK